MDDKDWQGRHMWNLQSNKNREAAFYGTLKIPFLFPKNDWQQLDPQSVPQFHKLHVIEWRW